MLPALVAGALAHRRLLHKLEGLRLLQGDAALLLCVADLGCHHYRAFELVSDIYITVTVGIPLLVGAAVVVAVGPNLDELGIRVVGGDLKEALWLVEGFFCLWAR
jgi:ABC-type amino acid transport system permease subunit